MKRANQRIKSRKYLYVVFCLVCVVALFQAATATRAAEDPPGEPGDLRTYDIPAVSAASFDGDVRDLVPVPTNLEQRSIDFESHLQELETPIGAPEVVSPQQRRAAAAAAAAAAAIAAPAPAPLTNFAGLGRFDAVTGGMAGAGTPPDTNGDVGPNHYIISVNDAYGIYDKATGALLASFTENSLFSSGTRAGGLTGTGTLCDTNTFGDPVVLYDQLADRWILTNLAFVLNASGLWNPPIYQCFAASKSGDPVTGGWWVYAVRVDSGPGTGLPPVGTLDDYPKFGSWNDGCLYMGANAFNSSGSSSGAIFGSLNKSDMYSGSTLRGALGISSSIGTSLFPANLLGRAPNQMPSPGTPAYFVRNSSTTAFQVRKFTPGANCGGGGTMGAATTVSHANNGSVGSNIVPQPNTTRVLDSLGDRIMQKVQYRKVGADESLWVVHTARPTSGSNTRPQWAQINVTGGTIATTPVQQGIHAPDTTLYRWMASIAADTMGNAALGYNTSNATSPNFPSIAYAGRLVDDPPGTLPQTETQLIAGGGSQIFTCGGGNCARWGDYSSMSVDAVDDCTFWYTSEYYETQAQGSNQPGIWQTRIGSFKFPSCVPIYPIITCPGDITVDNDPNECGAVVNFTGANAATATGNPDPAITYSPASGSLFPVGTTTVTATATNDFGTDSCTFTVTVNSVVSLSPANAWIGLKNSDDVGTNFDLLAEVLRNGAPFGSGQVNNVSGGSSGFNNAVQRAIALALATPGDAICPGDTLSIRLSARIGVTGHRSGTARLWYNDGQANSRFDITVGGADTVLYLQSGSVLGTSPGPGPKLTSDVFADRAKNGNPFIPFGTWSKTF